MIIIFFFSSNSDSLLIFLSSYHDDIIWQFSVKLFKIQLGVKRYDYTDRYLLKHFVIGFKLFVNYVCLISEIYFTLLLTSQSKSKIL